VKKINLIVVLTLIHLFLFAQYQENREPDQRIEWWGDIDGYINQQAKVTLGVVNDVLKSYPPSLKEPIERKMALLMIDNVLHEENAASRPAVQDFFRLRYGKAVEEIRQEVVKEGAVIWKLYNHSFVIKTSTVTIGLDIQRGVPKIEGFTMSKELIQPLLDVVDVLFVSHIHADHADAWVAEQLISQNKPVVTPPDVFTDLPVYEKVIHPERKVHEIQEIPLPNKGFNLKVVNYPGHQGGKILNNVYLIFTPEGISFIHTGDQSNLEDFEWIDRIGDHYKVDIAMVNSWSVYPGHRLAKGVRPGLIISAHENEMGHTIDHREPYWLNYLRLGDPAVFPWIQMAWGEKFHYYQAPK
jgi:L-ascorbate metabolism protein UlaG (beta-lactamase superfamily)